MFDKINEIMKLQDEASEEYGIISVQEEYIQIYGLESFMNIAEPNEIKLTNRDDSEFNYELNYTEEGMKFIVVLDDDEYSEYKKSRATNTTKEKVL